MSEHDKNPGMGASASPRPASRAEASAAWARSQALDGAGVGTWCWDIVSGHVDFDEAWCSMLGFTLSEISPDVSSWEQLVHPDDMPAVQETLREHLEGRTPHYETIHRVRTKSGGWAWILDRGRVLERDDVGRPLLMAGTHLDVTDRHAAEAALAQRERLLDGLAVSTHHLLASVSLTNDDVMAALEALGEATGVDRVYIFEHIAGEEGERGFCSQRYEWAHGAVEAQIDNPDLQMVPWDLVAPRWYDEFQNGGFIAGDVVDFPDEERETLDPQDILSLLALPIVCEGRFWGFIGFDACRHVRAWATSEVSLLAAVANTFGAALERGRLGDKLRQIAHDERDRADEAVEAQEATLEQMVYDISAVLGRVVEMRDSYTSGHQQRTVSLSRLIAKELGLDDDRVRGVEIAALLHDVGKLSVPAEILNRSGELRKEERDALAQHPRMGFEILKGIAFPWPIAEFVLRHHERFDGSGYPDGLAGEAIPLEARILGVADTLEAMISDRPYRMHLTLEGALEEIDRHAQHYDPDVLSALHRVVARGLVAS